ncbi:MAG: hypothetical protein NZL96_02305 [Patescibacteria group bacterium]|nr:hypothetical protein [Patescibacteria group bacterium]
MILLKIPLDKIYRICYGEVNGQIISCHQEMEMKREKEAVFLKQENLPKNLWTG